MLTCKDFDFPCCPSCHEDMDMGIEDVPLQVYDKDGNLFAEVCCLKVNQAELRAAGITEVKNE